MASDISLAVGDGARRMTYAELAQARAISEASARRLARRHHWPRQVGNDGVVRVIVPLGQVRTVPRPTLAKGQDIAEFAGPRPALAMSHGTDPRTAMDDPGPGPGQATDGPRTGPGTNPLAQAVETLREQLSIANERALQAEQRVDALYAALIEERRRVIEILTGSRRPWWRRWLR